MALAIMHSFYFSYSPFYILYGIVILTIVISFAKKKIYFGNKNKIKRWGRDKFAARTKELATNR